MLAFIGWASVALLSALAIIILALCVGAWLGRRSRESDRDYALEERVDRPLEDVDWDEKPVEPTTRSNHTTMRSTLPASRRPRWP